MSIDLDNITSGFNLSKINNNFQKVENELNNNVLRRDGVGLSEPNHMNVNLDMNGFAILNGFVNGVSLDDIIDQLVALEDLADDLEDILNQIVAGGGFNIGVQVNSIAVLRLFEPLVANQAIYLSGYYSTTKDGGGMFYYDATDVTSVDDDGVIIVTAGGKRWKRQILNGEVTLDMFGLIGDGLTNDTVKFQSAINSCKRTRYNLVIPPKSYAVNHLVINDANAIGDARAFVLKGAGAGKSFIRQLDAGTTTATPCITIGNAASYLTHMKISGFTMLPVNTSSIVASDGLFLQKLDNGCSVTDVTVRNHRVGIKQTDSFTTNFINVRSQNNRSQGYFGDNQTNNCMFLTCQFNFNNSDGFFSSGYNVNLIGSDFEGNTGNQITVSGSAVVITGCYFERLALSPLAAIKLDAVNGATITGNFFYTFGAAPGDNEIFIRGLNATKHVRVDDSNRFFVQAGVNVNIIQLEVGCTDNTFHLIKGTTYLDNSGLTTNHFLFNDWIAQTISGTNNVVNTGKIFHGAGRVPKAILLTPSGTAPRFINVVRDGDTLNEFSVILKDQSGASIGVAERVEWTVFL